MLKISSKRRRTLTQIRADKEAKAQQEAETAAKLAQFDAMQQKIAELENDNKVGNDAASLMRQFMGAGLVQQDDEGSFVIAGDGSASKFRPSDD